MDKDGYISNGELFQVLKMMVGNNLKDTQLQQIVDKTIINADKDGDGRISFEEFCAVSLSPGWVFWGLMPLVNVSSRRVEKHGSVWSSHLRGKTTRAANLLWKVSRAFFPAKHFVK